MTRRVPNLLAAASLLLSTAVAALWLRSYRASDRLDYQGEQKLYSALSNVGTLQVVHVDRDSRRYAVGFYHRATPVTSGETWWGGWHNPKAVKGILSFGVVRGNYFRVVVVPWWFVLGLAALPAIVRIRFARRSRERTRLGLCPACGYDLRATPDHCPECGATVSMVAVACTPPAQPPDGRGREVATRTSPGPCRPVPRLRLRPPRDAGDVPGMRPRAGRPRARTRYNGVMPEWVRTPLIIFGTLPLFFATMLAVESTRAAEEALLVSGAAWVVGVTWWLLAPVRLDARRARRARLGQCTRCGYDLTANVSGVCPECGGFT